MTYAPEGFYEFYNQRRRWSPSTMANIFDLLKHWKNVTQTNEDISKLYILYQAFLLLCSILTPGTIFLMMLEAFTMAFPSMSPSVSLAVNVIPVVVMVVLCFVAKANVQVNHNMINKHNFSFCNILQIIFLGDLFIHGYLLLIYLQLAYAAILSIIYSLFMMWVLVGLLVEANGAGFCSVTTIFLLFVVGVMIFTALLHPLVCHANQIFISLFNSKEKHIPNFYAKY